jgi:SOS-response transcriptional repressor LexA
MGSRIRIPVARYKRQFPLFQEVAFFYTATLTHILYIIIVYFGMNTTGFPSPAQGYEEKTLNFNSILVKHPAATFCMRYTGRNMESSGILPGDILIVDSSDYPGTEKLAVINTMQGDFRCVKLEADSCGNKQFRYADEHGTYHAVVQLFGIVTGVVRCL